MRRIAKTLVLAGIATALAAPAGAQGPGRFGVEGRLGMTAPTGQWNETNAVNYGYSAGVNGQAWLAPSVGLYAGWDWNRFTVDRSDIPHTISATVVDHGFRAGVISPYRIRGSALGTPFLFAGGMFNRTSYYLSDGRQSSGLSSNDGLGYEVGVGLRMPIGGNSLLTPSLRYRTHEAVYGPVEEAGPPDEVTYILVDVGVQVGL